MNARTSFSVAGGIVAAAGIHLDVEAAQLGPYVGGMFGTFDRASDAQRNDAFTLETFYPDVLAAYVPSSHSFGFDSSDTGFGGFAGQRIHEHLAVEALLINAGESRYRAQTEGTILLFDDTGNAERVPLGVTTTITAETTAVAVHALGIWPINKNWEVYARGGVQFSMIRIRARLERASGTESVTTASAGIGSDSALDLVGGLGVAWSLTDAYGLRADFTRVFDAGSEPLVRGDLDAFTIGVIIAF